MFKIIMKVCSRFAVRKLRGTLKQKRKKGTEGFIQYPERIQLL